MHFKTHLLISKITTEVEMVLNYTFCSINCAQHIQLSCDEERKKKTAHWSLQVYYKFNYLLSIQIANMRVNFCDMSNTLRTINTNSTQKLDLWRHSSRREKREIYTFCSTTFFALSNIATLLEQQERIKK